MDRSVQFNEHPLGNRLEHEERDVLPLELRFRDLGVTRDSSRRDIDNSKEGIFGGIERCEVSAATVFSKPHVLKTLLKDDPESVIFFMESASRFAMKAIEVITDESGSKCDSLIIRRSASLSATSQTSGGGIDQEEEMATQFDNVDFEALKRAKP